MSRRSDAPYKVGDPPPPEGAYVAWHTWAEIQHKGGLRQMFCDLCRRFYFPQERCEHLKSQNKPNSTTEA